MTNQAHALPPTSSGAPPAGAVPPWARMRAKKTFPNSTEDPNRPKTSDGSGGFVARQRLKQQQQKLIDDKMAKEEAIEEKRKALPQAGFTTLIKMKKKVDILAKKQTIKRISNHEQGHYWYCFCCGKKNRPSRMQCQVCSRSNKYCDYDRVNPCHGRESAIAMRSLQANYSFRDDLQKTNRMDDGHFTPLHNACMAGNPGLTESLVNAGGTVEAMTCHGFKPLHFACSAMSLPCVKILVDSGAKVNTSSNDSGLTPLHCAAKAGHPGIVSLLLSAGAIVDPPDAAGRSPLHYAAEKGHVDTAITLVEEGGADTGLQDCDGWSPKQISEFFGHSEFGEYIFRCENPSITFSRMTEFPPESWHSDIYFGVRKSVQKEKKQLAVMVQMQAEVREMVRLAKGGKSFLDSTFHAEMTGEGTQEQLGC